MKADPMVIQEPRDPKRKKPPKLPAAQGRKHIEGHMNERDNIKDGTGRRVRRTSCGSWKGLPGGGSIRIVNVYEQSPPRPAHKVAMAGDMKAHSIAWNGRAAYQRNNQFWEELIETHSLTLLNAEAPTRQADSAECHSIITWSRGGASWATPSGQPPNQTTRSSFGNSQEHPGSNDRLGPERFQDGGRSRGGEELYHKDYEKPDIPAPPEAALIARQNDANNPLRAVFGESPVRYMHAKEPIQ